MKQRVQQELKEALLQKDELRVGVLRMLLAAFVYKEKENLSAGEAQELSNEHIQQVVKREMKKRKQAAEAFDRAGRTASAEKEKKEMEILQAYLMEIE